jgi:hypothetical protein
MMLKKWVRLPSLWIENGGLRSLRWGAAGHGADNTAALMALAAIAHTADEESGVARATYDGLCAATGLSRAKLSNGLSVLESLEVIKRTAGGRSLYKLTNYDPKIGWAKLPAKSMYFEGRIAAFDDFRLRRIAELDALKLFFLFVARRGRDTNLANISYDKIQEYTGIERARIKSATSLLASVSLAHVERAPSSMNELGVANAYRIVGVDPYVHMGTIGRRMDQFGVA